MTEKEIINNEKYHTCGRCRYDCTPDDKYPCAACIHGTDHRTDLWELRTHDVLTNGTPIPKRHGRLIDVNDLCIAIAARMFNIEATNSIPIKDLQDVIDNAPTIIEADKEVSE